MGSLYVGFGLEELEEGVDPEVSAGIDGVGVGAGAEGLVGELPKQPHQRREVVVGGVPGSPQPSVLWVVSLLPEGLSIGQIYLQKKFCIKKNQLHVMRC